MMLRVSFLFAIVCALLVPDLSAAPKNNAEAQRFSATDRDILLARRTPKRRSSRKKKKRDWNNKYDGDDEEDSRDRARPLSSKQEIEVHLQSRIKRLKKFHKGHMLFGRRMSASWVKFWDKIYDDRKLFDVRMARQRLNLFESLASLDPSAHRNTITDFERLQTTQVKFFESNLKKKMSEYLSQLADDLKDFTAEEEEKRKIFNRDLMDSWQSQKGKKNRKGKRR